MSKFCITTPIYYVNDKPHVGHAYTTIAADVLARYHRLKGEDVFFLTGTDEHGLKILQNAEKAGQTPQAFCDENADAFIKLWESLNISYDNFIRTTDPVHEEAVKKAVITLNSKDLIYVGKYEGLYCVGCEQYKTTKELVDGKCSDHQKEPILLQEDCYFFKLSAFQDILLKLIDSNELIIDPLERRNEILGFLKTEKLEDISITRKKVKWGIKFPLDEEQTIYVWIDAFLNYLTGLGWQGDKEISKFWPADVQLMAKDILRVHATIWPAMLLALDMPLPKKIFAHGYFTFEGQKMSKSLGNVIDPIELINLFGADASRYLIVSACPFGQDGDISKNKLYDRYNSDLANNFGNLISRVFRLAERVEKFDFTPAEIFKEFIDKSWQDYHRAMKALALEDAVNIWVNLLNYINKNIETTKPWALKGESFNYTIYQLLLAIKNAALMVYPFMPEKCDSILKSLGLNLREKADNMAIIGSEDVKQKSSFDLTPSAPILRSEASIFESSEIKKPQSLPALFPRV